MTLGIFLPFAAWFIAKDYLQLDVLDSMLVFVVALAISGLIFRIGGNYLENGFNRSYVDGGSWDRLARRFEVDSRPAVIEQADIWEGIARFDKSDVVFPAEATATSIGLYVNTTGIGRLLIPWDSIVSLRRFPWELTEGRLQMVTILFDDSSLGFDLTWHESIASIAPPSIGIS